MSLMVSAKTVRSITSESISTILGCPIKIYSQTEGTETGLVKVQAMVVRWIYLKFCVDSLKKKHVQIIHKHGSSINHTFSIAGFSFIFVISLSPFANVCSNISEFNCLHTPVAASSLYLIMDHVRFYINGRDEILNWFVDNCTEQIGVSGFT